VSAYLDPDVEWNAALDLIRELSDELAGHGWGDFHYGDTGQDKKVAALVAKAQAFLEADK